VYWRDDSCKVNSIELRISSSPIEHHMMKDEFQPPMFLGKLLVSELSCEVGLKHGLVSLSSNMLIVCVTSLVCVWCSGAAVIAAFTLCPSGALCNST
jgi:hypothetical protein